MGRAPFYLTKLCEPQHQRKVELYFGFLIGTDLILDTVNNHVPYWKMIKTSSHVNVVLGDIIFLAENYK